MKSSYERVFGLKKSNEHPVFTASILSKILNHTLNESSENKVLCLTWGEYVNIREYMGIDLRLVLTKRSDIESFHSDNIDRYIKLSYKNYETHLYFDEQIKSKKISTKRNSRFKTQLPKSDIFNKIISTSQGLLEICGLSLSNFVFADTETTGLFNADHVIELGIVDSNEVVLFESMLKPKRKRKIHPMAVKAHGITESKLADKPRLIDVQNDVMLYLKGKYVVFYNAKFDVGKMLKSSDGHIFDNCSGVICLMQVYKDYHRKPKNTSLIKACDSYDIAYRDLPNHRAVGDAIKTARLCTAILDDMTDGLNYISDSSIV